MMEINPRQIHRKRFLKRWIIVLFFSITLIFGSLFSVTYLFSKVVLIELLWSVMPKTQLPGINVLIFGIDDTKISKRSDTILVAHLDHHKKRVGILSIPRDTYLKIPEYGHHKVNHAYAYGGTALLKKTLSNFLNIPIQYHVKVQLDDIKKIVNYFGGIHVDIEKDLYYVDKAGDLYIDLKKGTQKLDGDRAIQYLRFRKDREGDIGRINRQKHFMKSFFNQLFEGGLSWELPKIVKLLLNTVKTNFSAQEIIGLSYQFNEAFLQNNIDIGTIPGAVSLVDGVSYWRPDIIGIDNAIERVLLGFEFPDVSTITKVQTVDSHASKEPRRMITLKEVNRVSSQIETRREHIPKLNRVLFVEVLNGYGKPGMASTLVKSLRKVGIQVPNFGNAGNFNYEHTKIVDWKGNIEDAIALAQFLFIDPSQIIVYDRADKQLDITLVLGRDWETIQQKFYSSGEIK